MSSGNKCGRLLSGCEFIIVAFYSAKKVANTLLSQSERRLFTAQAKAGAWRGYFSLVTGGMYRFASSA